MTEHVDDPVGSPPVRRLQLVAGTKRGGAKREELIANLLIALESSRTIGRAQGILMAAEGLTTEEAFARLVELSQHSNVKLRKVAAEIVREADERGGPAG